MNAYRLGIAVRPGGLVVGATDSQGKADKVTQEAWEKANASLQTAIKTAVKTFPVSFTAEKAAQLLEAAVIYGQKMRGQYGQWIAMIPGLAWITPGYTPNLNGLQAAINKADDESKIWRSRVHLATDKLGLTKPYVYNKGKNKEWREVNQQVMRIYIEAAGLVGQRLKVDEARRDLRDDLNPLAAPNLWRIGIVVATVAAAGGFLLSKGHK